MDNYTCPECGQNFNGLVGAPRPMSPNVSAREANRALAALTTLALASWNNPMPSHPGYTVVQYMAAKLYTAMRTLGLNPFSRCYRSENGSCNLLPAPSTAYSRFKAACLLQDAQTFLSTRWSSPFAMLSELRQLNTDDDAITFVFIAWMLGYDSAPRGGYKGAELCGYTTGNPAQSGVTPMMEPGFTFSGDQVISTYRDPVTGGCATRAVLRSIYDAIGSIYPFP
jgi:hypothetical protein